jgi:uncharacterized protein YuzE
MKVTYDAKTDTLNVVFRDARAAETIEPRPGVILEYDAAGNIVSIEVLDAARRHTWQSDLERDYARTSSQTRKTEAEAEIDRLKQQLVRLTEGKTYVDAEVERLKVALALVNEERDVLKKTIAYFAKEAK